MSVPNFADDKVKLRNFLNEFYEECDNLKEFTYKTQISLLHKREQQAIYVKLDDIESFDKDLCRAIEQNGHTYQNIICECIDEILYAMGNITVKDSFDSFINHRLRLQQEAKNANSANNGQIGDERLTFEELNASFPIELSRRYDAFFVARKASKCMAVRNILSDKIGKVIRVKAIVTRATQVKPMLKVATYSCDRCAAETYQEILNQTFLPLVTCNSSSCKNETGKNAGRLHMITRNSKFVKLQELRIQEVCEQVPIGNIPRGMLVHCTGANTRLVQPGDNVFITGVILPSVSSGSRGFSQSLTAETSLDAHSITVISEVNSDDLLNDSSIEATQAELDRLSDPLMYDLMARSIAPEIFGHDDIKKALLIMLSGGTKVNTNGMKIRGSLNLCLMGDPGVAKSQLLGFVDRLSPRSQYTTGRGCSGAGLTAAVVKDQLTNEMTLEAGSLVLADGGVCCIDEFDKMSDSDRTAIHEVMEQQTISIAKAGIATTLNARVSILAAANPAYGRYNNRKSIEQNIDLPAALLSRFDMLWLIQDRPDKDNDLRLGMHIAHVHREGDAPPHSAHIAVNDESQRLLSISELRRYLAVVRSLPDPRVPASLNEYFVGVYVSLRQEHRAGNGGTETLFTSPRTLLSLIRISTSIARLNGRSEVDRSDANEAVRLMECSKMSVCASTRSKTGGAGGARSGYMDVIYQSIRRLMTSATSGDDARRSVRLADVADKCTSMGYTPDQVNQVIDCYEELNVWHVNVGRTCLSMI